MNAWSLSGRGITTMRCAVFVALLVASVEAFPQNDLPGLPDPVLTPGAINPLITQENIQQTICESGHIRKGYTKTIRPPVSYTNRLKREQIRRYRYVDLDLRDYEEDHLVPLCVGGHPEDPRNLWPQPRQGQYVAELKDELEAKLCRMTCAGQISLRKAQEAFAINWIASYNLYVAPFRRESGASRIANSEWAE